MMSITWKNELSATIIHALKTSQEFSDLTIVCKNRKFKVHKVVVCSQIKPFAAMMNGVWAESDSQVITLEDEDVEVVEDVMNYLYNSKFCYRMDGEPMEVDLTIPLPVHLAKLYIFGDKWDMPAMQKQVIAFWKTKHDPPFAVKDLHEMIPLVWHSILNEDDAFKLAIADMVRRHFPAHSALYDVLVQVPEFWSTLFRAMELHAEKYKTIKISLASTCNCKWTKGYLRQCQRCKGMQVAKEPVRALATPAVSSYSSSFAGRRRRR